MHNKIAAYRLAPVDLTDEYWNTAYHLTSKVNAK